VFALPLWNTFAMPDLKCPDLGEGVQEGQIIRPHATVFNSP
jgi:pyruvate/2-oxoglutarate dehydrogenase complex dihydrolipoamide acyltransferase (E2) component